MDGWQNIHPVQYQSGSGMGEEGRWVAMERCMEEAIPRLAMEDVCTVEERCLKCRNAKSLTRIASRWLVPSLGNS